MSWLQRLRQWWSGPVAEPQMVPPPEMAASPQPKPTPALDATAHRERRRKRQNAHVATQAVHGGF